MRGLAYPDWATAIRSAMPETQRQDVDNYDVRVRASDKGSCAVIYSRVVACWGDVPPVRSNVADDTVYTTPVVLTFNR